MSVTPVSFSHAEARPTSDSSWTLYSLCAIGVPISALAIYTLSSSPLVAPPLGGPGGLLEAALRFVPLAIGLPLLFATGVKNLRLSLAVVGWLLAWIISTLVGAHPAGWTMQGALAMLFTYAGAWALTAAVLAPADARRLVSSVAVLPAAMMFVAIPLWLGGVVELMEVEPATGRERLGGLLIAASWASVSLIAILASMIMIATRRRAGWIWLSIALGVLLLSQGRGAMVTLAVASVPLVARLFIRRSPEPRERYLRRTIVLVLVSVVALLATRAVFESREDVLPVPIYLEETVEQSDASSGRDVAWPYFLDLGRTEPIFGHGASAIYLFSLAAEEKLVRDHFQAAHNEYIQLFVEFGALGLLIVVVGIVAEVRYVRRSTHPALRVFPLSLALAFGAFAATDNATGPVLALPLCLLLAACKTIDPGPAANPSDVRGVRELGSRQRPTAVPRYQGV